jgi:hypothetical protein
MVGCVLWLFGFGCLQKKSSSFRDPRKFFVSWTNRLCLFLFKAGLNNLCDNGPTICRAVKSNPCQARLKRILLRFFAPPQIRGFQSLWKVTLVTKSFFGNPSRIQQSIKTSQDKQVCWIGSVCVLPCFLGLPESSSIMNALVPTQKSMKFLMFRDLKKVENTVLDN